MRLLINSTSGDRQTWHPVSTGARSLTSTYSLTPNALSSGFSQRITTGTTAARPADTMDFHPSAPKSNAPPPRAMNCARHAARNERPHDASTALVDLLMISPYFLMMTHRRCGASPLLDAIAFNSFSETRQAYFSALRPENVGSANWNPNSSSHTAAVMCP